MGFRVVGRRLLQPYLESPQARQSALLMAAQGLGMLLALAFTILITQGLDVAEYGSFRYALTFMALAMTLLQFGWPYSAARVLALEADPVAQRGIAGACVVLVAASTLTAMVCVALGFHIAEALGYRPPQLLLWVAPFVYVTLGQGMITSMCQGLNRIAVLSFQQVFPYVLLLPATALQVFVFKTYSLSFALATYVAVFSVVIVLGFLRIGVSFSACTAWLRRILAENRRTGFPIYIGGVFGVASVQLVALWVAEFTNPERYGNYALALAVASPLAVLVSSIGTVVFRSSSRTSRLSSAVLSNSLGFGLLLAVCYLIAVETLLVRVLGPEYGPAVRMAQVLGLKSVIVGWGDIFQRFLGAQGLGKRLGMASVATGIIGLVSAAVLLPRLDVYGAIGSSLVTGVIYLACMTALYLRHTAPWRESALRTR